MEILKLSGVDPMTTRKPVTHNFTGNKYLNLSGSLLQEWEACKLKEWQKAQWEKYRADLAAYQASLTQSNCTQLVKPVAPTLQIAVKTPVDVCDFQANEKAEMINNQLMATYQREMEIYLANKNQCVELSKPIEPNFPDPAGYGGAPPATPIAGFTGFTGDENLILGRKNFSNACRPCALAMLAADGDTPKSAGLLGFLRRDRVVAEGSTFKAGDFTGTVIRGTKNKKIINLWLTGTLTQMDGSNAEIKGRILASKDGESYKGIFHGTISENGITSRFHPRNFTATVSEVIVETDDRKLLRGATVKVSGKLIQTIAPAKVVEAETANFSNADGGVTINMGGGLILILAFIGGVYLWKKYVK